MPGAAEGARRALRRGDTIQVVPVPARARPRCIQLGPALINGQLSLRLAHAADQPLLFAWHEAAFRPHIEALQGWDGDCQRDDFARLVAHVSTFVVMREHIAIGYLQVLARADSLRLVNIALIAEARGQGVGERLLAWLKRRAANGRLPVTLGVFVTNPRARRFYERLGFSRVETTASHWQMRWHPEMPIGD